MLASRGPAPHHVYPMLRQLCRIAWKTQHRTASCLRLLTYSRLPTLAWTAVLVSVQNELQQKISAVIGGREEYNMEKQNRQARLDALQVRALYKTVWGHVGEMM